MKKSKYIFISIVSAVLFLTVITSVMLYSIDLKQEKNKVIIGTNKMEIVEDFDPPSEMKQGENSYKKAVRIKNTGDTDAYVRVFVAFSSEDIENISQVSGDNGETYSSLSEYTPDNGWVNGNNSYYYYEEPIAPGEYTPYLFTNVKTTFETSEDVQQYELLVYGESIQVRDKDGEIPEGFDYSSAWDEYLERTKV